MRRCAPIVGILAVAFLIGHLRTVPAEGPVPLPSKAVEPVTPTLPTSVVVAMQAGRFAEAAAALEAIGVETKDASDRAYVALLRGVALRSIRKFDDARVTLSAAVDAASHGPWATKLRAELAAVHLASGRSEEAEKLAHAEAETLLAATRKDRLAEVYRTFAQGLLAPADPLTPANPTVAHDLLIRARTLARDESLRARLLFEAADASRHANQHDRAVVEYADYLKLGPAAADHAAARFHLGEAQLAAGQTLPARTTLSDLARDDKDKNVAPFRARALYLIARSYGTSTAYPRPTSGFQSVTPSGPVTAHAPPADDAVYASADNTQFGLQVAALRKLMSVEPTHPLAVKAAFYIGQIYQQRGKSQEALTAYRAFLQGDGYKAESDKARRLRDELFLTSEFEVASVLRSQGKLDEAVAAWKALLARSPSGPNSSDARRAILDTLLESASVMQERRQFVESRTVLSAFLTENPLDPRVPSALFQTGESFRVEGKTDDAIAAFEGLIRRFPNTEFGAHASYQIGLIFEENKGNPARAIEQYRNVSPVGPWQERARQRVAVMEAHELQVVTPRTFRTGEKAHLKVATRNLERLHFAAYKLDPEAFFRKKQAFQGVESLDIGLVAPDVSWSEPVPGYGRYKPVDAAYDLKGLKGPGFWAVKVTDDKTLQATTMVLLSDLEAVVKASREQVLVFAQDVHTGKPRAGARVLASDGSETILEAATGPDGVVVTDWPKPRNPSAPLCYLVLDGSEAAGTGLTLPDRVQQGLSPRAYLYTDRPVYRPGQTVNLRGVVREVEDGRYAHKPGEVYSLEVFDAQGRKVVARAVTLSEFGTFHAVFPLADAGPAGTYRVRLFRPNKSAFNSQFEVQPYELEKADLRIDLPRAVVFRGETIKADVVARYQYGTPLTDRPVVVTLPDGRTLRGSTDSTGKFPVEFPTDGFADEQSLRISAQLPEENVSASASVALAVRAFRIDLTTDRDLYLDGESFTLHARTLDPLGGPTGQPLVVSLLKRVLRDGLPAGEREVSTTRITTDPKTGRGEANIKVDDPEGGSFILRASGTDRFGNAVVEDRVIKVSGRDDPTRLRLLADRSSLKVGEPANVNLHNRAGAGLALLTWEADRLLTYKLVEIKPGDNPLTWDVDGGQFPNFTLSVARMDGARLDETRLDLRVTRDLRVVVKPARPSVGPGDDVVLDVSTFDQLGRPVAAELSLAMVDRALLRLHGDTLPPIGPYFHDRTRTGAFVTRSTNAFRYAPTARSVAGAKVEVASSRSPIIGGMAPAGFAVRSQAPGNTAPEQPPSGSPRRRAYLTADDLRRGADDPRSRLILRALESVVAMNFPDETPLEDVIKYVKAATSGPELLNGIPIYVDPVGLQEAEKTMTSAVTIDLDTVPLRLSLRLALKQLGLTYTVGDGLLTITSESSSYDDIERNDPALNEEGRPMMGGGMGRMSGGMGGMGGGMAGMGMGGGAAEPDRNRVADIPAPEAAISPAKAEAAKQPAPEKAPPPRPRFVETAYWNPAVITGKDGTARVTFKAPGALSEYVLTARGITASESLAGQTTADLAVRKDFFVDVRTPPLLVEGDKPRFLARVHHTGVRGKLDVRLTLKSGDREHVDPKTLELTADGVDEVRFEPYEVPDGDTLRLVVSARVRDGGAADVETAEIPIRPWGTQQFASASGKSENDATAFVELPPGRTYENTEMLVVVSPGTDRLPFELALGRDIFSPNRHGLAYGLIEAPGTTADHASDLLAAASVLQAARTANAGATPEAERLTGRVRSLAADFIAAQNADGGWPWASGGPTASASERLTSARVAWALAASDSLGLLAESDVLGKAANYLLQELHRTNAADHETRAALLHALAMRGAAGFEPVNALNRVRLDLSDEALVYLALTLSRLDRAPVAGEVLDLLAKRARVEPAGPDQRARRFWSGPSGSVEATALAALAFSQIQPGSPEPADAVEWLLAHRVGAAWLPNSASGVAVAALSASQDGAKGGDDRYRLTVSVNGTDVFKTEVAGRAEGQAVAVPRGLIKANDKNKVSFDIEGRGSFSYAVTLTGFSRDLSPRVDSNIPPFAVRRRVYLAPAREFDGRTLPAGFDTAVNPVRFENQVTQIPLGGRARVVIDASGGNASGLILHEPLPAGTSLVEGSVRSQAAFHRLAEGVLTFYFPPGSTPEGIAYEVYGTLAGDFRIPPSRLTNPADPALSNLGAPGSLRVLNPGEPSVDPYRPTPDELYARGKALFEAGRLTETAASLELLKAGYTLRDDVHKDVARMLLYAHIAGYQPRKIVEDFEVIREKSPELVVPFDKLLVIGRAYADIGEHERAYLGWRALIEASYLEDAGVAEVLRQRGKPLEAAAYLVGLWREYPGEASVEADVFALSQILANLAANAERDPAPLAAAGVTPTDLLKQASRLIEAFLARSPGNPLADEASLALIGDKLELRDFQAVVETAARSATLYPKSPYLDRFHYTEALGRFHLGEYDRAIELADAIASRPEGEAAGSVPEVDRRQAQFLLGQIHEARRQPAQALGYYRRVADRYTDAAEAVVALTRRKLSLPEVSVVRPGQAKGSPEIPLTYRNVDAVEIKVYPVDLLRFYLDRRSLDAIAGIDLAGVRPRAQIPVKLGDGSDFEDRTKSLDLTLKDEGAFLVIARAGNLYASGIVVVTTLDLDVTEQTANGLLRVSVRETATGARVPDLDVKVIGSQNDAFLGGRTDLRGVFLAEGVRGQSTVVAHQGTSRYALYQGSVALGRQGGSSPDTATPQGRSASLEDDLKSQNQANQRQHLDRFEKRSQGMGGGMGGMGGMMGGGFR